MNTYYIKWNITSNCHLNCEFCNNKKYRNKWADELDEYNILKMIFFLNSNKYVKGITLSGGEPTLAKNFNTFCNKIQKNFGFITSGAYDIDENFLNMLENKYLKFITVSLDSLDAKNVSEIRGSDVLEKQTIFVETINKWRKVKKNNIRLFLNVVLTSRNKDDLFEVIKFASDNNIDRIQIFRFSTTGSEDKDSIQRLSIGEEIKITQKILNYFAMQKTQYLDIILGHLPGYAWNIFDTPNKPANIIFKASSCGLNRNTLYLKTDGKVNLCKLYNTDNQKYEKYKNTPIYELEPKKILIELFQDIGNSIDYSSLKDYYPCSLGCKYLGNICNPCVLYSINNPDTKIVHSACMEYFNLINKN